MTRRHLVALTALMVSLAAPASSQAATLSREGTTVVFQDVHPSGANAVYLSSTEGEHIIGDSNTMLTDAGSGCSDQGGGFWLCTNVTAFRIETGGGNDQVDAQGGGTDPSTVPLTVELGAGDDWVYGGIDSDILKGGLNADTLNGGDGNDLLDGGFGPDWIQGNDDFDVVTYAQRSEGVRVDLGGPGGADGADGSPNDGPAGARDKIQPDVEGAIGGSGDDVLKGGAAPTELNGEGGGDMIVGTSGADTLEGRDGADSIVPLGGPDSVFAGSGVDFVSVRDGEVDAVDCGPDGDHAHADSDDVLTSCEPPPPPDPPAPPAPPAPTIVTETITLPSRVFFDLGYTFAATRRATVLRNFAVEVEPGARVAANCRLKGKRCKGTRDFARAAAAASTRLRGFEGKRLPVGAKLTIQVTKDGSIGVVKTLTIRGRRAPSVRTLCLPPGATRPSAC